MTTHRILVRIADGLVRLEREDRYGTDSALWSRCKLRTFRDCAVTGREMQPGDVAYRPVGNQMYRMERIAAAVLDER